MMKWLRLFILLTAFLVLLIPSYALADSSQDVTVTAAGYICGVPGGLTLTYINDYEVGISWIKGADAENTMVRGAVGRVPESRTDGYQVYYGSGTSCSDTGVSLDETAAPIGYRAWHQNAAGVWEKEGVSDSIEGVGVTIFIIGFIVIAFMTLGFIFKNGILFLASSLGWVLFAFLMYGKAFENAAMNTGLLMFGGAMAIISAVLALSTWVSRRPQRMSLEGEQESYRRRILRTTRRRR